MAVLVEMTFQQSSCLPFHGFEAAMIFDDDDDD
jgi:hypothetical protein